MAGPLPPIPNVIEFNIRGTNPGEVWENTLMFQFSGTSPSVATLQGIAGQLAAAWQAHITPWQIVATELTEVVATDMSSNTGNQGSVGVAVAGGNGDDPIPANAAVLISYPSSMRYRGGHFRTYLVAGGFAQIQDAMNWSTTFVGDIQTAWAAVLNGMVGYTVGGTQITQHVGVRRHGKYLPNAGAPAYVLDNPIVISLPTNSFIVHQQMASQKGRIGRRSK